MDKYALMCEKSEEIQALWKPKVGDWFYKRDGIGFGLWLVCRIEEGVLLCFGERASHPPFNRQLVEFRTPEEYIWLPLQHQSQKMVYPDESCSGKLTRLQCFYGNEYFDKGKECSSFEELLLAFVMKEKWNKAWNGKEWA